MTLATPAADSADLSKRVLLGIFFMCLASTLFPIMNGLVQVLSDRYSSPQIVWARTASHLIFIAVLFLPQFGFRVLGTNAPKLQLARSFCLLSSTLCFFHGIKYLELAQAVSISFITPFLVALLSWPMLRERVSLARFVAVVVGFAGVLIIIQPGGDLFNWASLFIVASAGFYAFYQIFTRRVAAYDLPETSAIYSALVGTVVMSVWVPFEWTPVQSAADAGILISLGILGGLGHYCVARAMTYAPANVISPFHYWQLIGAVVVGYFITLKFPDATTWLGAAVIISAGLYIGYRETREKRRS